MRSGVFPGIEMELCGFSLRNWTDNLEKRNSSGKFFQLKIFLGIKEGLLYLHGKGILHRDFKPENIFFTYEYCLPIKIGDFGLATELPLTHDRDGEQYSLTKKQGTPRYRAPEVEGGLYGFSADLYSFGLVVWEVVQYIPHEELDSYVNRLVHSGQTDIVNQHPLFTDIRDTIVQLTMKDPENRLSEISRVNFLVGGKDVNLFAEDSEDLSVLMQAATPGSIICLQSGVYSGTFQVTPYVSLQGSKEGSSIIQSNGVDQLSSLSLSTNCRLQDITLKNTGIYLKGNACTIERVTVNYAPNWGLRIIGSKNNVVCCKFENCFFGILVTTSFKT